MLHCLLQRSLLAAPPVIPLRPSTTCSPPACSSLSRFQVHRQETDEPILLPTACHHGNKITRSLEHHAHAWGTHRHAHLRHPHRFRCPARVPLSCPPARQDTKAPLQQGHTGSCHQAQLFLQLMLPVVSSTRPVTAPPYKQGSPAWHQGTIPTNCLFRPARQKEECNTNRPRPNNNAICPPATSRVSPPYKGQSSVITVTTPVPRENVCLFVTTLRQGRRTASPASNGDSNYAACTQKVIGQQYHGHTTIT